jgi:hypothetical protein
MNSALQSARELDSYQSWLSILFSHQPKRNKCWTANYLTYEVLVNVSTIKDSWHGFLFGDSSTSYEVLHLSYREEGSGQIIGNVRVRKTISLGNPGAR